jgi:hypothetical protein
MDGKVYTGNRVERNRNPGRERSEIHVLGRNYLGIVLLQNEERRNREGAILSLRYAKAPERPRCMFY